MSDIPLRLHSELESEAMIGGYKILVVEGPTDREFIQQWLTDLSCVAVVVMAIDEVDLEELPPTPEWGARQKVAALAEEYPAAVDVVFLIDLDVEPNEPTPASLLRTEFPALESYALTDRLILALLIHLRKFVYSGSTPSEREREAAAAVKRTVALLWDYLYPLYVLRSKHRRAGSEIEFPEDLRSFRQRGASNMLDVGKLKVHLKLDVDDGDLAPPGGLSSASEMRPCAYGHDIARSLWAIWTDLRQREGLVGSDAVERVLLSLVRPSDLYGTDLFGALVAWSS